MKYVKYLFIIVLIIGTFVPIVVAEDKCTFNVIFQNDSDEIVTYNFKWIDHPVLEIIAPLEMVKGDLPAKTSWKAQDTYLCGEYLIIWKGSGKPYYYAFSQRSWMENPRILTWPANE